MGFKCKNCGWTPKESSYYMTTEEMKTQIFGHEKTCPVKPRDKYDGTYK